MDLELLLDGVKLMVLGMGTVFIFLILMVFCISAMTKALQPFAGMLEPPPAPVKSKRNTTKKDGADDKKLAAVAMAAVHAHRSGK
ncbi:MAG: OadG family protein [Victivallaceae bacterium]